MFPTWRLQLREARLAWQSGRYEDAAAMVLADSLRSFLPARQLAGEVAAKFVERADRRFNHGDTSAGWQDLATADRLGSQADAIARLRNQYAERTTDEAIRYLAAGQTTAALERLEKLRKRGFSGERIRLLERVATLMHEAGAAAARGHFTEAAATAAKAAALVQPHSSGAGTMNEIAGQLDRDAARFAGHASECQRLSAEMYAALREENWGAALSAAEALLEIAPDHAAAAQARRRAWSAVGMEVTQPHRGSRQLRSRQHVALQVNGWRRSTRSAAASEVDTMSGEQPQRALLWVDAVGGFLVCLDDAVTLGQPGNGTSVAIPILADLSRRHAVIRRESGAYILEPLQRVGVNGRVISGPHMLSDQDLIQLGDSVRVRFAKPHALSATAKLKIESHHKTQPSADAVLLMADSCVLGPNRHCHIRCRDWQHDVVVYRRDDRIYCRADEPLAVNGSLGGGEREIESGVRVEGEEFAFTWEAIT